MFKYFKIFSLIGFIAVLATGCLFEEADEPVQQIEKLNLETDMEYIYRWVFSVDSGDGFKVVDAGRFALQVVDTNATFSGEDNLSVLKSTEVGSRGRNFTTTWYLKTDDEFTAVAFSRNGANPNILPKNRSAGPDPTYLLFPRSLAFAAVNANSADSVATKPPFTIQNADTTMRIEPRIVYEFPFLENKSWVSFEEPFLQTRKIDERRFTTVEAGTFATFTVITNSDFFRNSFRWKDFVAENGLIKREISFSIQPFDEENNPLPKRKTTEQVELVEIRPL